MVNKNPLTSEMVSIHRLANGITVTLERLPHLHSASVGVWVRAGSANEAPQENGLAHFLEHLFFKGTKNRNVREIMEAIEGRGGQINAFTSREHTCLYVRMLSHHVGVGIEILADILSNSLFCDMEKERNVILEEIASIEDTPDELIHDLLAAHQWPDHPLGRPISGTQASVSAITRDDVQKFFERCYVPENMFVSVAGNFDEAAVLDQIRTAFEPIPATMPPGDTGAPPCQSGLRLVARDIAQAHICLGFPAPTLQDDARYVCDLLSSIIGGGSTSRLFERIREQEGLAYAIYSFHSFHTHAGMMGVYAGVAPQQCARAMDLIFGELRRIREEPVSDREMEMNREQIKGNLLMAMENTSTRMSRMAKSMMYHGRMVPVEEIVRKVDAVTAEDVMACARRVFTKENCAAVILHSLNGCKVGEIAL